MHVCCSAEPLTEGGGGTHESARRARPCVWFCHPGWEPRGFRTCALGHARNHWAPSTGAAAQLVARLCHEIHQGKWTGHTGMCVIAGLGNMVLSETPFLQSKSKHLHTQLGSCILEHGSENSRFCTAFCGPGVACVAGGEGGAGKSPDCVVSSSWLGWWMPKSVPAFTLHNLGIFTAVSLMCLLLYS